MARKVIWTDEAVRNLDSIFEYIAQDSPLRAAFAISRILERVEQAAQFPHSGRAIPEYGVPSLRELFWREYRILYRVREEAIVIRGVVHGRRILKDLPEN